MLALALTPAEMASTGEVAAFGRDVQEAYWASLLSTTGFKKPRPGTGVLIGGDVTKPEMRTVAKTLLDLGFKLYCSSPAVEEFLNDIPYVSAKRIFFPKQDKRKLREVFDEYDIECVINLARARGKDMTDEDYVARRYVFFVFSLCCGSLTETLLATLLGMPWTLGSRCLTTRGARSCSWRALRKRSLRAV